LYGWHDEVVEWASTLTVIGVMTAVIGLQTFWVAHAINTLRDEMYRGFDRIEARLDRLEGREPPSLRRV
jgi:hypothetical protein